MVFDNDLLEFIQSVEWTSAKTMPEWPHEYIVRERVDEILFVKLVKHIRNFGYEGQFYSKPITYFDYDGMTYWTMGAPIGETIIINRCRKEDTFEERKREGRLPK
jgi:hypothetical protein